MRGKVKVSSTAVTGLAGGRPISLGIVRSVYGFLRYRPKSVVTVRRQSRQPLLGLLERRGRVGLGNKLCRRARVGLTCGSGQVRKDVLSRRRAHCVCRAGAVTVPGRRTAPISSVVRAVGRFRYFSCVVSITSRRLARGVVGTFRHLLGSGASSDEGR